MFTFLNIAVVTALLSSIGLAMAQGAAYAQCKLIFQKESKG